MSSPYPTRTETWLALKLRNSRPRDPGSVQPTSRAPGRLDALDARFPYLLHGPRRKVYRSPTRFISRRPVSTPTCRRYVMPVFSLSVLISKRFVTLGLTFVTFLTFSISCNRQGIKIRQSKNLRALRQMGSRSSLQLEKQRWRDVEEGSQLLCLRFADSTLPVNDLRGNAL
jgi:hypothetical protein